MFRSGRSARFLATILFTDIVGSTDLAGKLGDRAWRRLVAAHHAAVRRELRRFGGQEVDTAGDGFLASFGQPAEAIRSADAIVEAVAKLGVSIRAGLHTGETELGTDKKIGGIAVHIASRVMAAAGPGEVLVSGTLRDLVAGSGLEFTDRGVHELKGLPGTWQLWSLVRARTVVDDAAIGVVVRVPSPGDAAVRRRRALFAGVALAAAAVLGAGSLVFLLGRGPGVPSTPPVPQSAAPPSFALHADTIVILRESDGSIAAVRSIGTDPESVALDSDGAWVGAVQAGLLTHVDGSTFAAGPTVGRVGRPTALAIGNGTVWVADGLNDSVSLVEPSGGQVRDLIPGTHVRRIAYGFDALWGTDDIRDRLLRFDRQSGALAAEIPFEAGTYPTGISIGPDAVWVANVGNNTVSRFDPASGRVVASGIALRGTPDGLSANGADVWVTSRANNLLIRIDASTNSVAATADACSGASAVVAIEGGVWVACAGSGEVWRIGRDGTVAARIRVGGRPTAIAERDGLVWVTVAGF